MNGFAVTQITALALFLSLFVGRSIHLWVRRQIRAVTLFWGRWDARKLLTLGLFLLVNIWAVEVMLAALPTEARLFPAPLYWRLIDFLPAQLLGLGMIVVGFVLFVWSLIDLGTSWRLGIDEETPGELVTGGIYALSRHPIYLFFDLYFAGTFLLNGTLIFLLFALIAGLLLHLQILQEEAFLRRIYGRAYEEYCARTGRYFGWRERPFQRGRARPGESGGS